MHFPRAVTRYWAEMHPEPFARGSGDFMRYYGILLERLAYRYVNGFGYKTAVPVADEEVPARFQRAEEVFAGKLWRDQLREWDETFKPASIATHKELQSVDPDALSDEELVSVPHALPRPSRGDDLPAHAPHRRGDRPHGRLPRARGRLDRPAAGRAARPHAGCGARFRRGVRRARAATGAIAEDPAAREILESEDDAGDVLERLRSLDCDAGSGRRRIPRPRGDSARARLRHLEPIRARAAGLVAAGDSRRRRWRGAHPL